MRFGFVLTSTNGRIARRQWWPATAILVAINSATYLLLIFGPGIMFTTTGWIIVLIVQIVLAYPFYAVSAKRFHDRDRPGSLAWIFVVVLVLPTVLSLLHLMGNPFTPNTLDWITRGLSFIVAVWFIVELGILPGTTGSNAYGPDPAEGRA